MEITADKLNETFGIRNATGEKGSALAAPSETSGGSGEKESGIAAPNIEEATDGGSAEGSEASGQDAQVNSKFAAMRRSHEFEIDTLLKSEAEKRKGMIKKLALKLGDGSDVVSEDDLERYLTERELEDGREEGVADEREESNTDERDNAQNGMQNSVSAPEVSDAPSKNAKTSAGAEALKGALSAAVNAQRSLAEQAAAIESREARRAFLDDIAAISYDDPSIATPEDLDKDPKIGEIRRYMAQGHSVRDSWRLAHFEDAAKRTAKSEGDRGLGHLGAPARATADDVQISPEQARLFKMLSPGVGESDMKAAIRKYQKK